MEINQSESAQRAPRAIFFGTKCLFDRRSGAAISVRSQLEALAAAGWQVESYTLSLCDGESAVALPDLLGAAGAASENRGHVVRFRRNGVTHYVLHAGTTVARDLEPRDARNFAQYLEQAVTRSPPDVAVTYGGSAFARGLQAQVRRSARKLVFFLANASYDDVAVFQDMDAVIYPSAALQTYYRETLGIEGDVVPDTIDPGYFYAPENRHTGERLCLRRNGFITYINPCLEKGGTLFLRLADMASRQRPDLTFLAVEGRVSRDEWRAAGYDLGTLPNVFWLPQQTAMWRVYQRTSALLFPAFWFEASGRSVAEAQLSGIPVVASDRGGIPAQLNGGGCCLPNPPGCEDNFRRVPLVEEVQPWLDTLVELLDDPQRYAEACQRAARAAEPYHPDRTRRDVVEFYNSLVSEHG